MAGSDLIVEATVRFLRTHVPFAALAPEDLAFVAAHARLVYFPPGATVLELGREPPADLLIVHRGHVAGAAEAMPGEPDIIGPGECFPVAALSADVSGVRRYQASDDVFCYALARADFLALRARSAPFAEFCARELATIAQRALDQLRLQFGQRAIEQQTLLQPVRALLRRAVVSCRGDAPLRDALVLMGEAEVGTIAVCDAEERPVGIFTLTDLLARVALPALPLATPVAAVMTRDPGTIDELATAQDALAYMADRGYHQLMVTRGARLVGVISERDLFAASRLSMRDVLQSIRRARGLEELAGISADIQALGENLLVQGVGAEPMTVAISALNDALTQRVHALLAPRLLAGESEWCWLALGSEGRREQTLRSDQDNAIVFVAPAGAVQATRARLLAFGRAMNEALAGLGFPLCAGGIMAGTPECCATLAEWRERFAAWVREPTPQALLAANIYFDLRPLIGAVHLAQELRAWVGGIAAGNPLFLRMLTANALQTEPPLGLIRAFRTDGEGAGGTIDLKTQATRLFVDAGRVLALAFDHPGTNTAERLRVGLQRLSAEPREIASCIEALQFLQLLRLRANHAGPSREAGLAGANRLDPYALNELEQRMLKEALRQARHLQLLIARAFAP